jgi:hypothetical protein
MKLNMARSTSLALEKNQHYFDKIVDKMGSPEKTE